MRVYLQKRDLESSGLHLGYCTDVQDDDDDDDDDDGQSSRNWPMHSSCL